MSQVNTTICDRLDCKKLKMETNHWWQLRYWPDENDKTKVVQEWYEVSHEIHNKKINDQSALIDLCSENCLTKAESRIRQGLDPRG